MLKKQKEQSIITACLRATCCCDPTLNPAVLEMSNSLMLDNIFGLPHPNPCLSSQVLLYLPQCVMKPTRSCRQEGTRTICTSAVLP